MAKKSLEEAVDRIGQTVKVGSIVVAPDGNSYISISRIIRITPKMVELVRLDDGNPYRHGQGLKKQSQILCIDGIEATVMHLLSQNL